MSALYQKRILSLTASNFVLRSANNEIDDERSKWFANDWFIRVVEWAAESLFFGYSLMAITKADPSTGQVAVQLIDRRRTLPQKGVILKQPDEQDVLLSYLDYPNELLFANLGTGLGLLEKAAPFTIYKTFSFGNWNAFEQIFGVPLRIAKVANLQSAEVPQVEQFLKNMGTAAYAVMSATTDLEVKDSNTSDANKVFERKIDVSNKELSKLVLGQTMTTDDGSSLSQSQTHADTEQLLFASDKRKMLAWLNAYLLPAMRSFGFKVLDNEAIGIPEAINPQERRAQDAVLLGAGVRLSKEYLEKHYDVEIDDRPQAASDDDAQLTLSVKKKA